MSLIRINKNPSGRQLIVFGVAWLGILGVWGWTSLARGRPHAATVLWTLSVGVPLLGAVYPRALKGVYLGLSYATYPIGIVVSHGVLALLYFLVLTPVGLTMRMFRYDPLARKFDPKAQSYWTPRDKKRTAESYFNQS
jgi:multisubunit Na+/H+ antiporter MnhG subunit